MIRRGLPVVDTEPTRRGPDRRADRQLTYFGLAGSIGFVVAAAATLVLPPSIRLGPWVPLHLVLAGAIGTAIAAMLPFFVTALASAPPGPLLLRAASLALVAGGAIAGVTGRLAAGGAPGMVAAAGAACYVLGMAGVGMAAALPLRHASGTRRPATEIAYAVALLNVIAGVSIAALYLAGDPGPGAAWPGLRVAHAWLNLLGFAVLVVAGTLVHFAPTVAGSRIRRRPSGFVAVALLAIAAPLGAAGYAAGTAGQLGGFLTASGALALAGGALALVVHGIRAQQDRAGWTTDREWHAFTGGSLLIAPGWLLVAALVVLAAVLQDGAAPTSWRLDLLAGPLVIGFLLQVLLGALSHLLPAIGPGTPEAHALQRQLLGRRGWIRLAAWNAGAAMLTLGGLVGLEALAIAGLGVVAVSGAGTVAMLVRSLRPR